MRPSRPPEPAVDDRHRLARPVGDMGGEDALGGGAVEEGGPLEQDGPGRGSLDLGLRGGAGGGERQQDGGEEPDGRTGET